MSSNTEDVEMRDVEDDSDEEDAVEDELGALALHVSLFSIHSLQQQRKRSPKKRKRTS